MSHEHVVEKKYVSLAPSEAHSFSVNGSSYFMEDVFADRGTVAEIALPGQFSVFVLGLKRTTNLLRK